MQNILVEHGKAIFAKFLEQNSKLVSEGAALRRRQGKEEQNMILSEPDETILFRQLRQKNKAGDFDETEEISATVAQEGQNFLSEIKNNFDQKIYQLTGYSDPIYAEAIAEVHHYDILLKIVLMNRT